MSDDIEIRQGKTYSQMLYVGVEPIIYKAISGITQTAPVRLHVPGHSLTDGWRVAVTNARGMTEINAVANNLKDRDFKRATVVDADHIELNSVNAAGFSAYESGGEIQFDTPADLSNCTARMKIRKSVGGTVLLELTTENGRLIIHEALHAVQILISAADAEALTWKTGVYDLELVSSTSVVSLLAEGSVVVTREATTPT